MRVSETNPRLIETKRNSSDTRSPDCDAGNCLCLGSRGASVPLNLLDVLTFYLGVEIQIGPGSISWSSSCHVGSPFFELNNATVTVAAVVLENSCNSQFIASRDRRIASP